MKKLIIGVSIIVFLFIGCIFISPYWTLHNIKSAVKSNDNYAISEYIDFPSVRQSIKDQMNVTIAKEIDNEKIKDNPFAVFGAVIAESLIDVMIDAYITPAGLAQIMSGKKIDIDIQSKTQEKNETVNNAPHKKPFSDASMGYKSFKKFVVSIKDEENGEVQFVLRRYGLSWKLTEIILPI
ncbi:MAG: DUF2939 domain-containing protein [Endomicrobium sp.]|nr:DUF2939 domain-containing protein [Endomicrobium sp.]